MTKQHRDLAETIEDSYQSNIVQDLLLDEGDRRLIVEALYTADRLSGVPAQPAPELPPLVDRAELVSLLQDLASVNLSREAVERQARRMADDLIARGLTFAARPPAAPVETRKTFTIPPGHEAVRDSEGRATGEVRPRSSAAAPVETDKTMDAILHYLTKECGLVYDELSTADFDHIRGLINGAPHPRSSAETSALAEAIKAKMAEPAFVRLAASLPQINELRYLPVIKQGPCSVSDWYVLLPSGKEAILSKEDWEAATVPAQPQPTQDWLAVIEDNCWDLRCRDVPTGGDDYDIVWDIIEHYQAPPKERVVGNGRSPLEALQDATSTLSRPHREAP